MKNKFPLIKVSMPDIDSLVERLKEIWKSGWFSNNGPCVQEFEKRIAEFYGVSSDQVVTCCNATIGLMLAMKALKWDSPVLVPSYTFIATVQAIQWNNLKYKYVDISPNRHCALIDSSMSDSNLLIVLPYGCPAIVPDDLKVVKSCIIDAASSFGNDSSYIKKYLGIADAMVFSLHATKSMGIGEGGVVIFKDKVFSNRF